MARAAAAGAAILKAIQPRRGSYRLALTPALISIFFGRLKNMSEAERQNYLATEEAQRAVHILLVSNVAQSYFNQQLAYAQLQIAEETLRNYQQSYAFVEKTTVDR